MGDAVKPKLPSASALDRAGQCPASQALPHIKSPPGEPAKLGQVVHQFLEDCINKGPEAALAEVPAEYREICASRDLSTLPTNPELYSAEVPIAWDYVTGKARIMAPEDRERSETELLGIADVLASGHEYVYIGDYKTGHGYVTEARRNSQLRFLALAAATALGKTSAVVEVIALKDDGTAYRDRAVLDALDLDGVADDMRRMVRRIEIATKTVLAGFRPDVREGVHCRYCPAWEHCPAKRDLLAAVVSSGAEALTSESLTQAYRKTRDVVALGKRAMDRLKEHATRSPIELGDGWYYGPVGNQIREHKRAANV